MKITPNYQTNTNKLQSTRQGAFYLHIPFSIDLNSRKACIAMIDLQQLSYLAAPVTSIAIWATTLFTLWKMRSDAKIARADFARKEAEVQAVTERHQQQLEQNKSLHVDGVKLSLYVNITQRIFEIDRIFIEHPTLRPFFYDGTIVTPNNDKPRITALAEYILDFYSTLQEHESKIKDASPSWAEWTGYIEDGFKRSPFLCCYFLQRAYWYEPGLAELLNPIAKQNDALIKQQRAVLNSNVIEGAAT
jgi:hypothetical protein